MNAITQHPPYIRTLPPAEYHRSEGVSKSNLDMIHASPALLEWSRKAPLDDDAKSAVNIGTALHTMLLEPDRFAAEYVADFSPPKGAVVTVDDLRAYMDKAGIAYKKSDSKAALTAVLLDNDPDAPVSDALHAEWARGLNGRIVLSAAEARKLKLMRESVMAHPMARKLIEADGHVERCHFWTDPETGELCRARMDKEVPKFGAILDVKSTADMDRFSGSILEFRYHVQDAFYSTGYTHTTGDAPRAFLFLAVSTTRDACRYPVRLFSLTEADRDIGTAEYRADLETYARCRQTGIWPGIEAISLPSWYIAKQGAQA